MTTLTASAQYRSEVWSPDNGDGTYTNPVINADYSDPDVCVIVFDGNGTENRTCEGPKFYKRDGWYWIMCPAGGVPTGFQLAMRSKSPYGPYEHYHDGTGLQRFGGSSYR